MKVIIYATPQMGHLQPLLHLTEALVSHGHHVTVCVSGVWESKLAKAVETAGCSFYGLDGLTLAQVDSFRGDFPGFKETADAEEEPLLAFASLYKPDVIVSDFISVAGHRVARRLRVPLVLNSPSNIAVLTELFPLLGSAILGRLVVYSGILGDSSLLRFVRANVIPSLDSNVVLVNSAWGLDRVCPILPHLVVTGPLAPRGEAARTLTRPAHAALLDWMARAPAGTDFVYVTTGSITLLSEQQVQRLYAGFAACECWVIWSLKEAKQAFLPSPVSERFFVSGWVPQLEVLALPQVKLVLTHGGWGGVLECMQHAKPIIGFPGFADQPDNVKLLVARGCGLALDPKAFTASELERVATRLLVDNEAFAARAKLIQRALLATGGAPLAVRTVEWAAEHGVGCLVQQPGANDLGARVQAVVFSRTAGVLASVLVALAVARVRARA